MEDYSSFEKPFQDTINYINENFNLLEKNRDFIAKLEENERNEFVGLESEFKKKYNKYKNIKRFSIPIIGTISSGKSTFLNFLFGMNCLESGNDIVTKCVVIIRHNKNLEQNKSYIYSVNIKERNEGFYDFEKIEETKSDDLNNIIKERNSLIRNSEKMPNKEDFFLIIEANIPLFRRNNSKFANFFEFLDLPGLDEGKDDTNNYKTSDFFKQNILTKILDNSLFSIFIFDAGKYMRDENYKLFNEYIDKHFKNNYSNSFFILNKIDLMDNETKEKKIFESEMLINKLKLNLKDSTLHIKYLSCKNLTKEIKKYEDFQSYLKYLLIQDNKGEKNFLKYLKTKMAEELGCSINEIDKDEPSDVDKKNIIEKIRELKMQNSEFSINIKIKEYHNYSKAFDESNKRLNKNEEQKNEQKSKQYQELYNDFNKSFKNTLHNFLNIPNDKNMKNRIKNILTYFNKISDEKKKSIKKTQEYLDLLYKDINDSFKLTIEQFNNLKPIVDDLSKEGNNLQTFENLKTEFQLIEFFIKKDKKIRIPLFGGYSTGKSSLLNCIIGTKLLPEGNQVTTRKIIVIRNNEDNKYTISKTDLVKTNNDYYCFEDGDIINNYDTPEKIYEFLKKENENQESNGNMCYLLTAPIFLFKKLNISKEILNKIEFIDFPGIDATEEKILEKFNNLADLSDTFIFVNECDLINNKDNIKIMRSIVNRIESRSFNFDYNSCLFVLNKVDGENKNINKEQKKKDIEDILFGEKSNSIFDFFKRKENPEITVSLFSCHYFSKYLTFYYKIEDFEKYINNKIEEISQEENDADIIEQLEDNLNEEIETDFEKIEDNKKMVINDEYLSILKSCLKKKGLSETEINDKSDKLNNIINYYNYMKNNSDTNQYYIGSKFSTFIKDLEKKIIIAKDMTEKQFNEKIKVFMNTLQNIFRLLQQKSINKVIGNMSQTKEQLNNSLNEIYTIFSDSSKKINTEIDSVFKELIEKVESLIKLGKSEETKTSDLKDKINEFKNEYKKEIKSLDDTIKTELISFQVSMKKKISGELLNFNLVGAKSEENLLKMGFYSVLESISVISTSVFLLIGGLVMFVVGGVGKLIKFLRGKHSLIKDLEELHKELIIQWSSTNYKSNTILTQNLNNAIQNLKLIYDIQMSEINEKRIQELYEQFICIISEKYIGEKKDGKKQGYGVYYSMDKSVYQGYYNNDLMEGYGKLKKKDGIIFEGYYKNNEREGIGKIKYPNGQKYEGEFKNSQLNGFGIFTWKNGIKYIGEFDRDLLEGIGITYYENGNIFKGEYKNGKKNGIGTFYYRDGRKFEGEWKDGEKNGKGIFYYKVNKLEGYWVNNRRILDNYIVNDEYIKKKEYIDSRQIKIEYVDGDIYKGEYNPETNKIEGIGSYFFNHGTFYKGNFSNNVFSGKGVYHVDDRDIIGEFKNGKIDGYGEIFLSNGIILKGNFKDGKKEGVFYLYDKSENKTIKRTYRNDILKSEDKDI